MKRLISALLVLCILLPLASAVPDVRAAESSANIIRYVPDGDWNDPALSQAEKEAKAHTIHWLTGINPPVMGHEIEAPAGRNAEKAGRFYHEKILTDYYLAPYREGNGWYDVNKFVSQSGGGVDSLLCFVLSSVNLLHWWMEQNSDYIDSYLSQAPNSNKLEIYYRNLNRSGIPQPITQSPASSRLYSELLKGLYIGHKGGWPDKVTDFFINGYTPAAHSDRRNTVRDFPAVPDPKGGFFYPVFGKSILSDLVSSGGYDAMSAALPQLLDNGIGVIPVVTYGKNATHAITLWGAEYDESGQLCAVYVTDNNDRGNAGGTGSGSDDLITDIRELIGMIRYNAFNKDGSLIITSYDDPSKSSNTVISYAALTLGRDGWAHWKETGKPLYEDGRAFLHPPKYICDNHSFVYEARGSRIVQTCSNCEYSEWVGLKFRDGEPIVYDGTPQTPCIQESSLGTSYPFSPVFKHTSNINAGTGLATISYMGQTARLEFTILPKPVDAPDILPELISAGPYSVSVRPVPGMEFSADGQHWFADGLITGLEPETDYTVSVRTAAPADKNYTHSAPGPRTLSVRTAGESASAPHWSILSLEDGQVRAMNSGRQDTVTLVIAGYDEQGRQTFITAEEITGGSGQILTVPFTDGSSFHRAFLVNGQSVPVAPAFPAA